MRTHRFFFIPILSFFLLISCQENTTDAAAEMDEATAEMEAATTEIDVATAEKMVADFNAKLQQDIAQVMTQNTSDEYYFINAEGQFATKEQMVEMTKSFNITKWDLSDLKVRVFGDVLVATGVNDHTVVNNENDNATDYKTAFTYIYQVKDGDLEMVSWHHSYVQDETDE